jgi:DNA-binding CsgD family transcriptional regulator
MVKDALNDTEMEIAKMKAKGIVTKEIAAELGYSRYTIKNKLSVIYNKLGVSNQMEMANMLWREGVIE